MADAFRHGCRRRDRRQPVDRNVLTAVCFKSALPSAEVQGKCEQHDKNNENRLGEALGLFGEGTESKKCRNG
ncbi:hypothetical protein [Paraburkholderia sacchari]|uniref:hypothetical protein n=1 Tax=Paraburkholderia sacchari TaxID=159450 RepID=UPI0039A5308C